MKIRKKTALLLVLLITAAGLMAENSGYYVYSRSEAPNALESIQKANREVARQVIPVVVSIDVVNVVEQQIAPGMYSNPFEFFFGRPDPGGRNNEPETREFRSMAMGSGVIIRKDGNTVYVLTNNHVVGEAEEITVHLDDGRSFGANLVGTDPRRDIALVKFETGESIPVARLGNSDEVQVGDIAFAIGNPLGFSSTFTSGVVSAVGRDAGESLGTTFTDFIQTDAAINPGNSGGALANIYGEVIGINTWIASGNGGNVGLGFAIPINKAKEVIDDLITSGKVEYGWLGISMGDPSENLVGDMNLAGNTGAFVFNVYKGSPAWNSGIKPGDLITAIDGKNIAGSSELMKAVGSLDPGKRYQFRVIRGGERRNISVTITARDDESKIREQAASLWPGMTVVRITDEIRERLDLPKNSGRVMIGAVAEGSPAFSAGLRSGDIIKEINRTKIDSVSEFYEVLNRTEGEELIFKVNKQGTDVILGIVN